MTKPQVFRDLVIGHHQIGTKPKEIFQYLLKKVSMRQIYQWIKEYKDSGKISPNISTGRPFSITISQRIKIHNLFSKNTPVSKIAFLLKIDRSTIRRYIKKRKLKVFYFSFQHLL